MVDDSWRYHSLRHEDELPPLQWIGVDTLQAERQVRQEEMLILSIRLFYLTLWVIEEP